MALFRTKENEGKQQVGHEQRSEKWQGLPVTGLREGVNST